MYRIRLKRSLARAPPPITNDIYLFNKGLLT